MLAASAALAVLLLGGWSASRWLVDRWPARIEFRDDLPLCFTPDGRSLVCFNHPGRLTFRDSATGTERLSWSLPDPDDLKVVAAGAFSPDGQTFAAAIRRNNLPAEVALLDVASGRVKAAVVTRYPQVCEFGFTPDGTALRIGSADSTGLRELVSVNPTTAATEFVGLPAPGRPASGVASSPDGRFLVSLDAQGGPVALHETGSAVAHPPPDLIGLSSAGATGGIGFAADGRTLAIGRTDGTIDLWDIPGRQRIKTLRAHEGGYASASIRFGPDGRTIASGGCLWRGPPFDLRRIGHDLYQAITAGNAQYRVPNDLVVLDLTTGERLARSAASCYLYYSPDGRTVATRDDDGRIRLRDLPGR